MIARETNGYPPPPARPHDSRARESGSSSEIHARSNAASSASSGGSHDDGRREPSSANDVRVERPISESFQSAFSHVLEVVDHVQTLMQVRADRARIAVRRAVMIGVVIVLAAAALAPLIVGGSVLFTIGVAQSLTILFGDRAWLGNLIGGMLILGLVALCAWAGYARIARRDLAKKAAKYEHMRRVHEARFGPSAAAGPEPSHAAAGRDPRSTHV